MKLVISADLFFPERYFKALCFLANKMSIDAENSVKEKKLTGMFHYLEELYIRNNEKYSKDNVKELMEYIISMYGEKEFTLFMFVFFYFYYFLKNNAKTIVKNKIDSCDIIWPRSYLDSIKYFLDINPYEYFIGFAVCNISIDKDFFNFAFDTSREQLFSLNLGLSQSFLFKLDDPDIFENSTNFISECLMPLTNNIKIDDATKNILLNVGYCNQIPENNNSNNNIYRFLPKDKFYYFIEDQNNILNDLLLENKLAEGLTTDSMKVYNWDLTYIYDLLWKLIEYKNEDALNYVGYHLSFIESLDDSLDKSLRNFISSDNPTKYITIICDNDFIKENIIIYLNYLTNKFFLKTHPDDFVKSSLSGNMYFYVNSFSKAEENKKHSLWNTIIEKPSNNNKVVFFENTNPTNSSYRLQKSIVWSLNTEIIEDNLSKIFHSFLPIDIQNSVDEDVKQAIGTNKFINLIKVADTEIDIRIMNEAIDLMDGGSLFNYRYAVKWYNYREMYRKLFERDRKLKFTSQPEKKPININFSMDGDKVKIEFPDKIEKVKYHKSIVYTILVIKYWQEFKEGIDKAKLVSIVNAYIRSDENNNLIKIRIWGKDELKKRLEEITKIKKSLHKGNELEKIMQEEAKIKKRLEKGPNTSSDDSSTLHSALYGDGVAAYKAIAEKTKKFIKDQIIKDGHLIKFIDINSTNENEKYVVVIDESIEINLNLFGKDYRDHLRSILADESK